jgi:hypothetical protein
VKTIGIIAGLVALVLLLSFTLVACDDQPAASSGVELDIDGHKKAKPKTSTPRKPTTTRKARR